MQIIINTNKLFLKNDTKLHERRGRVVAKSFFAIAISWLICFMFYVSKICSSNSTGGNSKIFKVNIARRAFNLLFLPFETVINL